MKSKKTAPDGTTGTVGKQVPKRKRIEKTGKNVKRLEKNQTKRPSKDMDRTNETQSKKTTTEKSQKQNTTQLPYKNFSLRPSICAKWTPISKSTESFVTQMLSTNVSLALNKINAAKVETAQDILNSLRTTLVRTIRSMKVPKPAVTSYKQLQANTGILEEQLQNNTDQIRRLDEALNEEYNLLEALENEKAQLEEKLTQTPSTDRLKLHPNLQEGDLLSLSASEWRPFGGIPLGGATYSEDNYNDLCEQVSDICRPSSTSA